MLAQELEKPVIKNLKRKKFYARFSDDIWAANLPEMRSLSSFNCNVKQIFSRNMLRVSLWLIKNLK